MLAVGLFFHPRERSARTIVKRPRRLAVHDRHTFEVIDVILRTVHDQLPLGVRGRIGVFSFGRLVGKRWVLFLHFQQWVLVHLRFDAFLQGHDRQLQNLHRLDHPRRQLLNLELPCFQA